MNCLSALLTLALCMPAHAAWKVQQYTALNGTTTATPELSFADGADASVSLNASTRHVRIVPDSNTTNMGRLTLSGGAVGTRGTPDFVYISIGAANATSGLFFGSPSTLVGTRAGNNWGGLVAREPYPSGATGPSDIAREYRFYGGINGNLTGQIDVNRFYRLESGGDCTAMISAYFAGANSVGEGAQLICRSISASGGFEAIDTLGSNGASGTIQLVRATGASGVAGHMAGQIKNRDGDIVGVELGTGSGTPAANLTGPVFAELGDVGLIRATGDITSANVTDNGLTNLYPIRALSFDEISAQSISANITCFGAEGPTSGKGPIGLLKATTGSITGNVLTEYLQNRGTGIESGFRVAGDMTKTLRIDNDQSSSANTIINGSLASTGELRFTSGAMAQQVIINAAAGSGAWSGPAVFGTGGTAFTISTSASQPLQAPWYDQPFTNLGGGAIGLVPFNLHRFEGFPKSMERKDPGGSEPASITPHTAPSTAPCPSRPIRLAHYGPVANTRTPDTDKDAVVFQFRASSSDAWVTRMDLVSTVSVDPGAPRDLLITPSAQLDAGEYRVSPTADVKSVVDGTPVAGVIAYTAYFRLSGDCPADLVQDGAINTLDLVVFLANFGLGTAGGCSAPGDLDLSGTVNTVDLVAFLGAFGTTCTGSRPGTETPVAAPVGRIARVSTTTTSNASQQDLNRGSQTPPGVVIAELGFASAEDYEAYVSGFTESQFWNHIAQVLAAIERLGLK